MVRVSRLGSALVLLAALGVSQAEEATIQYKDRAAKKAGVSVTGTIEEENLLGVKLLVGKAKEVKFIPAADIERIIYTKDFKDVTAIAYRRPFEKVSNALVANEDLLKLKRSDGRGSEVAPEVRGIAIQIPGGSRLRLRQAQ